MTTPNQKLCEALKSGGKRINQETSSQKSVITWFRLQFPKLEKLLIHVPNGGLRSRMKVTKKDGSVKTFCREGKELKEMGVTAGVADLLLLVPRKGFGCLAIEMKTETGSQSDPQSDWMFEMIAAGNKYVVCRSAGEAEKAIREYLQ
jgi:hypothetical protein